MILMIEKKTGDVWQLCSSMDEYEKGVAGFVADPGDYGPFTMASFEPLWVPDADEHFVDPRKKWTAEQKLANLKKYKSEVCKNTAHHLSSDYPHDGPTTSAHWKQAWKDVDVAAKADVAVGYPDLVLMPDGKYHV